MIHPNYNVLNFEEMANSAEPQNDREWMFSLRGEVKSIADSVQRLVDAFKQLREDEISDLQKRMASQEAKWQQLDGSWKTIVVICTVIATAIAVIIKTTFK